MSAAFDRIAAILDEAAANPGSTTDDLLALLDRVMTETRKRERAARLAKFGTQFKPAGVPKAATPKGARFARFQQVNTPEGYLGYIAGHDKHGKAIVNVVWEAAEYQEDKLTPLPGPAILDAMKT